ncbi:MAG: hypothetical protein ICV66_00810 [Chitinophagaceae bacterium]|nr:hypothetical protein [Chitinophagaceae bacterium]
MKHPIDIQIELRELNSSLPVVNKEPVFNVPEGYFDNFAASVLLKIKQSESRSVSEELESLSPVLSAIPRRMPLSVPEDYFSTLNTNLSALIHDDVLPATLSKLDKTMPYEVPVGYFNWLPQEIIHKVAPQKPRAKIVSFAGQRWYRYAAAAIITGIIALSGILYLRNNQPTESVPQNGVATMLHDVSNKDLDEFINTTDVSMKQAKMAKNGSASEVRSLLRDVSDKELDAFLSQVPTDDELLVN